MRRCGLCSLLCLLVIASPLHGQGQASEAELQRLKASIARVQEEVAGVRRERSQVQQALEDAEKRIETLRGDIAVTSAALIEARGRLDTLKAEVVVLDERRRAQQSLVQNYLRQAWRQGERPRLKLLLNQDDPASTARLMHYAARLGDAHAALVRGYAADIARLRELGEAIVAEQLNLDVRQSQLLNRQEELAAAQDDRRVALAGLDATLASRGAELERLEMERIEVEVLLEELRRSIADIALDGSDEPIVSRKGRLPWPVEGVVSQRFGTRHELGDLTWEGMTITAAAGTPVHAVHHGRVVFADWFGNSGLLLILDHGDGYMSLYAHSQELYRAVGDWVGGGEVIAATGSTGGQREPNLYFEFRRNGRAEDPLPWLLSRN